MASELDRNTAVILLAQDFVADGDDEKLRLLETIISNDTDSVKYSFKLVTGR